MAIPLSNDMREVRAPQTAKTSPVDKQQMIDSMGQAALGMNRQMQETVRGGLNAYQQIRDSQDAFKRNEAEREYNERTSELNTQLAQKQGEERVKFQRKYEAEMKLASDKYEAAINKVRNFEIREGSKRHINAWNQHNASTYQYQNYQNARNLREQAMGQNIIANNRRRVEAVDAYQTPESIAALAGSDAYGFQADAEAVYNFYKKDMGEPDEVVQERINDLYSKGALAMAVRYAQLAKNNSPLLDYDEAQNVYMGVAKSLGLDDGYTIEGRRALQQLKIDSMAKDARERTLMMTNGEYDPSKAHVLAPDLDYAERQKVFNDSSSGSGSGIKGMLEPVSDNMAEDFFVQVANVFPNLFQSGLVSDALNGVKNTWGSYHGADFYTDDGKARVSESANGRYSSNRGAQLNRMAEVYTRGMTILNQGTVKGADEKVVRAAVGALQEGLTDALTSKDFEPILGDDEARRNLDMQTKMILSAMEHSVKGQGGIYTNYPFWQFWNWGKSNKTGVAVPNQTMITTSANNGLLSMSDTGAVFGVKDISQVSKEWWYTPQTITVSGTTSSVNNVTGEEKSVTSSTPQKVQVIPMQYYVQNFLERERNTEGRAFVLDNNKIVGKALRDPSEWEKGEQDMLRGFTELKTKTPLEQELEKIRNEARSEIEAELREVRTAVPGGGTSSFRRETMDLAIQRRVSQKLLNDPARVEALRVKVKALEKAEAAARKAQTPDAKQASVSKAADNAPRTVNMADLGLSGVIDAGNSKPTILESNSVRVQELDTLIAGSGIKIRYTSAMGGEHAPGERSHAAGHKIDFQTSDGKRLPEKIEKELERRGFCGKGTGAVGWEINPKTGQGHYDVSITTPKGYVAPLETVAKIAFNDTPLHLVPNENDSELAIKYKNIYKDYRMGTGRAGTMTKEEFKRNYKGLSGLEDGDYQNYLLRVNADSQTQRMYDKLFADASEDNLGQVPHVFDISKNKELQKMVRSKYEYQNGGFDVDPYTTYVTEDQIFQAAESANQEIGFQNWAEKSVPLYEKAAIFPAELRRNKGLFLTDTNTHYYYDGNGWNVITGNAGRIVSFMGVLDQKEDKESNSPYAILSRSIDQIPTRNNTPMRSIYNPNIGDMVPLADTVIRANSFYKNITTADWRE